MKKKKNQTVSRFNREYRPLPKEKVRALPAKPQSHELTRFGIKFRHRGHYAYFILSVTLVIMKTIASIALNSQLPMMFSEVVFAAASGTALVVTKGGTRDTKYFSPECIWWNGSLCLFLLLLRKVIF